MSNTNIFPGTTILDTLVVNDDATFNGPITFADSLTTNTVNTDLLIVRSMNASTTIPVQISDPGATTLFNNTYEFSSVTDSSSTPILGQITTLTPFTTYAVDIQYAARNTAASVAAGWAGYQVDTDGTGTIVTITVVYINENSTGVWAGGIPTPTVGTVGTTSLTVLAANTDVGTRYATTIRITRVQTAA